MNPPPPRILVFGATGALGGSICRSLARTGSVELVAASRRDDPGLTAPQITVDLTDETSIRRVIRAVSPDVVVKAAGVMGAACDADPRLTHLVNVAAVGVMLEAAEECGASRFILPSSSAVYGTGYSAPVGEGSPVFPASAYAESKLEAESLVARRNASGSGLSATALRIFNVYGPRFSRSLVQRLLESSSSAPVGLSGLDTFSRDYVHVDDVVSAVRAVATAGRKLPTVMNIGSGRATSNRELVRRLGQGRSIFWRDETSVSSYSCADISLARRELGFSPESSRALL